MDQIIEYSKDHPKYNKGFQWLKHGWIYWGPTSYIIYSYAEKKIVMIVKLKEN